MNGKLPFWAKRRLQAPKCWFLAPSGARNQHFENPRPQFPENPNIISGKLLETTHKSVKNIFKKCLFGIFIQGHSHIQSNGKSYQEHWRQPIFRSTSKHKCCMCLTMYIDRCFSRFFHLNRLAIVCVVRLPERLR